MDIKPRILVVDDDRRMARTPVDILSARGFSVKEVTEPQRAAQEVGPGYQVVLLDMKLNGLGGLELLKVIRERWPELPVVLVTGHGKEMAKSIEAALDVGAYTCLSKPLEIDALLKIINEIRRGELGRVLCGRAKKR